MNLKEYLFYMDMTLKEFALIADISKCHLSSVMTGDRIATPKLLRAIQRATNGKVTAETIFQPTKVPEYLKDKNLLISQEEALEILSIIKSHEANCGEDSEIEALKERLEAII